MVLTPLATCFEPLDILGWRQPNLTVLSGHNTAASSPYTLTARQDACNCNHPLNALGGLE